MERLFESGHSIGVFNKEIASELQIDVCTVKNHVHDVLEKLGVARGEAAALWRSESVPESATRSSSPDGQVATS